MDYTVNIELKVPGDLEENSELLLAAAERVCDGLDTTPLVAGAESTRMFLLALDVDASDGADAVVQALELYEAIYSDAFPDLAPPTVLKITGAPTGTPGVAPSVSTAEEAEHELA